MKTNSDFLFNKLVSLEATLVRNSADLLAYLLTGVKCRATSVAKKVRKYVNVNMYIWNFSTGPPTQKMKHMFHIILQLPQNDDDDGGGGDMILQEKDLFRKVYYEGCLIGSIN